MGSGTQTFDSGDSAAFGDITTDHKIGDHGGTVSSADMGPMPGRLRPSGNDFVILHTGDGGHMEQFPKDSKMDLFLFHVNAGMDAATAINYVQARTSVASHILEMEHAVGISNSTRPIRVGQKVFIVPSSGSLNNT